MLEITDFQKIGIGFSGFGVAFIFLGILLAFDRGLLALGNILFIIGLTFIIGVARTFYFFFQKHRAKGSAAFFGGICVVLIGWPMLGIIIEGYGFFLLFRGFIPASVNFLRNVPYIGTLLYLPGISHFVNWVGGDKNKTVV